MKQTHTRSSRQGQRCHKMTLSHQRRVQICQKLLNFPAHSLTRCLSFCLALTATLLYQTAIKDSHMSNSAEHSKLNNGFVFLERLLRIHIIVFHLICVQGKRIFWPQVTARKLFHSLSISHSRFDSPEV